MKKRKYQPIAVEIAVHKMAVAYCNHTGMKISRYVEKLITDDIGLKELRENYNPTGNPKSAD